MNKQKILRNALVVVIAVLVLTTGVVFASSLNYGGPNFSADDETPGDGGYFGPMQGRGGRWSSEAPFQPMHEAMVQAVADATGLSVEAIEGRITEGDRLFTIAVEAGLSEEEYFSMMREVREAFLAEAVASGLMSQERYQWMLEHMDGDPKGPESGGCYRYGEEESPMYGGGLRRGRGRGPGK